MRVRETEAIIGTAPWLRIHIPSFPLNGQAVEQTTLRGILGRKKEVEKFFHDDPSSQTA